MKNLFPLVRWTIIYSLQVLAASLAGILPPVIFFLTLFLASPNDTGSAILGAIFVVALVCLVVVFPFCFIIAAPIAILVDNHVKLSLVRALLLAFLLAVPGIIYLDYFTYQSSGPDSGPPTTAYSLLHLVQAISSPTDAFLMIVIPTIASLLSALVFWFLRFRTQQISKSTS